MNLEDCNPTAELVGWLSTHPDVADEFDGGPDSEVVGPWPQLRVVQNPGGWVEPRTRQVTDEVSVEVIDHPGGPLGLAEMRRRLGVAVRAAASITERSITDPTATVVTDVRATSGMVPSPLPGGQPRVLCTLSVTAHPGIG